MAASSRSKGAPASLAALLRLPPWRPLLASFERIRTKYVYLSGF
jgi:hypothetical protein